MWTPPSVWKYQILNEASCGWDVLNSPLQLFKGILYGGHQTPDNLMVFDFKMPPALFLCWAQTFRRFHPQTALNHRKSLLTHCADTHTHTNTHGRDPGKDRSSSRVLLFVLQAWERVREFHVESLCGFHSTCVVTTRFTGVSDVALRFAWYKRAALNRRTYSHLGVDSVYAGRNLKCQMLSLNGNKRQIYIFVSVWGKVTTLGWNSHVYRSTKDMHGWH